MIESIYTSSKKKLAAILEAAKKDNRKVFYETMTDGKHNIYIVFYKAKGGTR